MKRILLVAAALALSGAALAQQYKWTENGRVRYGDVPPPGVNATRLKGPPAPSSPPAAAAGAKGPLTAAEKDAEFRKRQQDAAKEREKQDLAARDAQTRKENCARAQEYLRTVDSGERISRLDSKGERYYLDDEKRAQEQAKARQAVQQWCN